jgi:ribosomal protein S18 acetylase RimI-like enzyme
MAVRKATLDDVEPLRSFILRAWEQAAPGALGWTGASDDAVSEIANIGFLSSLLQRRDVSVFIAVEETAVVGFCSLRETERGSIELSGIAVLESMTGRGIGSRLLRAAVEGSRADGHNRLVVRTEAFNERAIEFYIGKGFEVRGSRLEDVRGTQVELVDLELEL